MLCCRLSEGLARMHLKSTVEKEDVEEAIRLMNVATQTAATDPRTGAIDMDMIATGRTAVRGALFLAVVTAARFHHDTPSYSPLLAARCSTHPSHPPG